MAPHSSTLSWKIPWMEEPGELQSMGSLGVRNDWATSLSLSAFMHCRRKWQPTPVFLPGESQGCRSLVGCCLWGSHRVGHNWCDLAAVAAALHIYIYKLYLSIIYIYKLWINIHKYLRRQWQPTPVFLENPRDRGACWAAVYGFAQSQTRLMQLSSSSSSKLIKANLLIFNYLFGCTRS